MYTTYLSRLEPNEWFNDEIINIGAYFYMPNKKATILNSYFVSDQVDYINFL